MPYDTKMGHADPEPTQATGSAQSEKKQAIVRKAMDLFREFVGGSKIIHNKCRDNDARYYDSYRIYREKTGFQAADMDGKASCAPSYDYMADKHDLKHYPTATPALYSVCESMIADLMGAYPEPVLLGRSAGDDAIAETLSAMMRVQRERGNYRREYRSMVKHFVRRGIAVMQCSWDSDADQGRGDVRLTEWDFLNFYPDPLYEDIQEGRAVFKISWKHRGWYAERYPKLYPMMRDGQEFEDERTGTDTHSYMDAMSAGQIAMIEYWYRKYDAKSGAHRIHLAKIAGGVLLECSEETHAEGVYAHGQYPFVMYRFAPMDGTPWGMGMVDLFGQMQDYIDFVDFAALKNMLMSAKAKLMVREDAIEDIESVTDWQRDVVKVLNSGGDIRNVMQWFQASPMSVQTMQQYGAKIEALKDFSGQNSFNRGEGGGGVTAATAIMALQEAGSKITNMIRDDLFDAERDLTELQMELTRQYYDAGRVVRIRADQNVEGGFEEESMALTAMQWEAIRAQQWPDGSDMHGPLQLDVTVKIQKAVNFTTLQQNQLMLELYQILAQSGVPVDPTSIIGLMTFDGKEAFLGATQKGIMLQMRQMQEQMQQMDASIQNLTEANQALQQVASGESPETGGMVEPEGVPQPNPEVPQQASTPQGRMEQGRDKVSRMREQMAV